MTPPLKIISFPQNSPPLKLKWGPPQFQSHQIVLKTVTGALSRLYPDAPPATAFDYDLLRIEIPPIGHTSHHELHQHLFEDCWVHGHTITPAYRNTMFSLIVKKLMTRGELPTPMEPLL